MPYQTHHIKSQPAGFTLIELVVVIVLLSVLVVSAYSRLTTSSGYVEYTYQARILSALRNMQTRAMQDTRRSRMCFQVNFVTSPPSFGPPERDYERGSNRAPTCKTDIEYDNPEKTNPDYLRAVSANEMTDDNVTLSATSNNTAINYIRFDPLGRPEASGGEVCLPNCVIELSGESTVKVCVESEGYIHACD